MLYGTDVASYQSNEFKVGDGTHPYEFVFIKATQGVRYVNPRFVEQRKFAISKGLRVGYYHFLEAGNAAAQITHFHRFLTSGNYLRPGDMIACDWESYTDGGESYNATNIDKNQFMVNALKAFPESRVVLYCNTHQYLNREEGVLVGDGLWIADPSALDGKPRIKDPWVFHQVGISGGQDTDVARFNTRAELDAWADGKVKSVTPIPGKDVEAAKAAAYHDVAETDAIPAPRNHPDYAKNKFWTLESYVRFIAEALIRIEAK